MLDHIVRPGHRPSLELILLGKLWITNCLARTNSIERRTTRPELGRPPCLSSFRPWIITDGGDHSAGLLKKKEKFGIEFERARRSREAEQKIVAPESKDQGSELDKERTYLERKGTFLTGHL